jgi:hypothetical protein
MFQTELDVDETLAQLLVAEGFTSLEEVAYVEVGRNRLDRRSSTMKSRANFRAAQPRLSSAAKPLLARCAAVSGSRIRWPNCPISPSRCW